MDIFLARQPILTSTKSLFGFELLYRSGSVNAYTEGMDGNSATYSVIANAMLTFDINGLTQGKLAFINFTRDLLMQEVPNLLEPKHFAIEILENMELDPPLIEKLSGYKEKGYSLILDDYIGDVVPEEALKLIDIIKVDFMQTDSAARRTIANDMRARGKHLLAEKVETLVDFQEAIKLGYEYFQGYYFSKPVILKQNAMEIASSSYVKLMRELTGKEINYDRLTSIIRPDVHLTYKLLKKMNTVEYYRGQAIKSLKTALVRMGTEEVRRWGMLILIQNLVGADMDELVRCGLIRATFCERLACELELGTKDVAFYTGMLSIIAQEDEHFFDIIESLNLPSSVVEAFRGGNTLSDILHIALEYEQGKWDAVDENIKNNLSDLTIEFLSESYIDSINYADAVLKST